MNLSVRLKQKSLHLLENTVEVPAYDRSRLKTGIVHIGVGGFHRSHEAFYTDSVIRETDVMDWGICGVGLLETDRQTRDLLSEQDFLYTVISRHPDGRTEHRVIGSLVDFLIGPDDPMAVINRMAHEDTRIVSLTITEGGYNFHPESGEFIFSTPGVQHDLENPDKPRLIFGYLTAALNKRRLAGLPPFTIQSCDNIQHNGDVTRRMLMAFAGKKDPDLAEWIRWNVSFPNSMVDRITPATTTMDIEGLNSATGVYDRCPVTCESFRQWVIEDTFANGRPEWEMAGAQFVPDVTPYEKMKIRLLNGGHSVLGLLGSIHGHETIDGTVADPRFARYLRKFMDIEVTPTLDEVDGIDLNNYKDSLFERFANPNIRDRLSRICMESSAKLPKFLIPTIRDNLVSGGSIQYGTLVIAAWCCYSARCTSRSGIPLDITDSMEKELHEAAIATPGDSLAFLRIEPVFGNLVNNERFTSLYAKLAAILFAAPDIASLMERILSDHFNEQ